MEGAKNTGIFVSSNNENNEAVTDFYNQDSTEHASMNKVVSNLEKTDSQSKADPVTLTPHQTTKNLVKLVEHQIIEHAWGEIARKNPVRTLLLRQLLKLDLNPLIIQNITESLTLDDIDAKSVLPHALAVLANQLPIYKEDMTACGGTVALLGAAGVGKTTAIGKMAARYALKNGRKNVALVTTDCNRIAAMEQLRIYSKLLGIPLRVARDDIELLDALNAFSDKSFVLIDTAGMGPKEVGASKFYELFSGGITQIRNFLVLPATTHRATLEETAYAFQSLKLDGSIITKVDETTRLGGPLSVAILNNLPVAYYSNGQKIPDDFHLARAHTLVSRAISVIDQFDELQAVKDNSRDNAGVDANVCI